MKRQDFLAYIQGFSMAVFLDAGHFILYYFIAPLLAVFAGRVGGLLYGIVLKKYQKKQHGKIPSHI